GRHFAVGFLHRERHDLVGVEGSDRKLRLLREPVARRVPDAGARSLVVGPEVIVEEKDVRRNVELVRDEPEENGVRPAAVPPVRTAAHAFADRACAFRVRNRALVEPVDLQLETVEAEVAHEMQLELTRGFVGEPATAKGRMDGEPFEMRYARTAIRELEPHRAGTLAVVLDHEPAEVVWLAPRALHVGLDGSTVLRGDRADERLDVGVQGELEEEVHVLAAGAADGHGHGACVSGARRGSRARPEPSETPSRIRTSPASSAVVSGSSSSTTP